MNGVLKTALVIGIVISVEALVLRRLFSDAPWNVFVGAFLVACLVLVGLQFALSKRRTMRPSQPWRRYPQRDAFPAVRNGQDSSSAPITSSGGGAEGAGAASMAQTPDPALSDENGIIRKENS